MTKFQTDLLIYMKDYTEILVEEVILKHNFPGTDNIFPIVRDFLTSTIKRDISLHDQKSTGYNQLIDILIELRTTKQHSQFADAILNTMNSHYIC